MFAGIGPILLLSVGGVLIALLWHSNKFIEGEDTDAGAKDGNVNRVVTQVVAAQRLRREAAATADPEERARLIRLADEADGTAEKIREGLLSDQ